MIKRIDELGRVVIPKEYRKEMGIQCNDYVDIYSINNEIVIKSATFCDRFEKIITNILKPLCSYYECELFLANKTQILFSTNENLLNKDISELFNEYFNTLPEISSVICDVTKTLKLEGYVYFVPVLENGYKIGALIISNKVKIDKINLNFISNLINAS